MFSGVLLGGLKNAGADPEVERSPPPPATRVSLPAPIALDALPWTDENEPPSFQALFGWVFDPNHVPAALLKATNIGFNGTFTETKDLLPESIRQSGRASTENASSDERDARQGAAAPHRAKPPPSGPSTKDFDVRLAEISIENDAAFRAIGGTTKPGVQPARLAYLRNFWFGLENMSRYWDMSLDDYYDIDSMESDDGREMKRQRIDSKIDSPGQLKLPVGHGPSSQARPGSERAETSVTPGDINKLAYEPCTSDKPVPQNTSEVPSSPKDTPTSASSQSTSPSHFGWLPTLRYKGRRTSTGIDMPEAFRNDTIKGLIEAAAFPFNCRLSAPKPFGRTTQLQCGNFNIPVRRTTAVYRPVRSSTDRRTMRLEGPILTVQARWEPRFGPNPGSEDETEVLGSGIRTDPRLDQLREFAGLMHLAQERAREGMREVKPGENKFWTSKPRWGGGAGGEFGLSANANSVEGALAKEKDDAHGLWKQKSTAKTFARLERDWKALRAGESTWDPGTTYRAIGKTLGSEYDEIFMLSSILHHAALLKLTVHRAYVNYTLTEETPDPLPADPEWSRPRFERTKWFDLFDVDDRVEIFRALWDVMAYQTRKFPDESS